MIDKATARYQEIPRNHMRCGNCSMMPGASCTLVYGVTNRNGWCLHWAPSDPNLVKGG